MDLNEMIKECTKPHPLLHTLSGVGLGLFLVGVLPGLYYSATVLGLILIIVGVGGEFMMKKK